MLIAVCYLRLDFDTFTLLGTGLTTEVNGGACQDSFVVTTTNTNPTIPTICGPNAGQHSELFNCIDWHFSNEIFPVYVDIGALATDTATLTFNFLGTDTTTSRSWEIKVTQVECFNKMA